MKAVILCAGEGTRLKPATETIPKPLLLINNKPILGYIFDSLPEDITEVYLIIQEKHKHLFEEFLNTIKIKVNILFQDKEKNGSYFALDTARDFLINEDKFLVLNGDDIFLKEDLTELVKLDAPAYGLSMKKLDGRYRTCDLDYVNKKIISFRMQNEEEKGKDIPCFSGAFTLNKDFFSYVPVYIHTTNSREGEAGIPHTLFNSNKQVSFFILNEWLQINTKEDFEFAQQVLSK
ncbi:MAG: NDP-sugar synthase [bacterium]